MRTLIVAALGLLFPLHGAAQPGDIDLGEASVFLGPAFGGIGTNFAIAGSIGTVVDRYVVVMLESGYIPMGVRTLVAHTGIVAKGSGLYDFNIAGHVRVPLRSRWEPYGILAPSLLYNHYQKVGTLPNGSAYYVGAADVKFGFETGAGARFYWKKTWGFKGEFGYTIATRNFSSIMIGVFRQF